MEPGSYLQHSGKHDARIAGKEGDGRWTIASHSSTEAEMHHKNDGKRGTGRPPVGSGEVPLTGLEIGFGI